jgi:hypothetical protein
MKRESNNVMKTDGDQEPGIQRRIDIDGHVAERMVMASQELDGADTMAQSWMSMRGHSLPEVRTEH